MIPPLNLRAAAPAPRIVMDRKTLVAGALALAVGCCACGSNGRSNARASDEPETVVSGLLPEPAGEDGAAAACSDEQCPELRLFGKLAPGCCLGNEECGGQIQLSERTWLCVPQSYDQAAQALSQVLARHTGEPMVLDPSCPSQVLDDVTLAGCCGKGGVCGLNTAAWTAEAARFGQKIPTACISPAEAARLTGTSGTDAGTPRSCQVGTTSTP
jgi:hypothetical protein